MMKKLIIAIGFSLISIAAVARADYSETAISRNFEIAVADENGEAIYESQEGNVNVLLMGFNASPVILDISNPYDPALITNYDEIETRMDIGIYLQVPKDSLVLGVSEDYIVDIEEIEVE